MNKKTLSVVPSYQSFPLKVANTVIIFTCLCFSLSSQDKPGDINASDKQLFKQYIESKNESTILFDSSNIKQFWIDQSVSSQNGNINIFLKDNSKGYYDSIPQRIQLANVNESMDCKIEVLSNTSDVDFIVLNDNKKTIAQSTQSGKFINYHISSSIVHLEEINNFSFNMVFSSKTNSSLSIKEIVLSFPKNNNSSFLSSSESHVYDKKDIMAAPGLILADEQDNLISIKGSSGWMLGNRFIICDNKSVLNCSVKIKNIGTSPVQFSVGYKSYDKNKNVLDSHNYPYKENKPLKVISAKEGEKTIVVDSVPEWHKGCYLALDAKEDFSDIPNQLFVSGQIESVNALPNNQAEIVMNSALTQPLAAGSYVRVNDYSTGYIQTNMERLQPNEEKVLTSTIKKDDSRYLFSSDVIPYGVYSVKPLLSIRSLDPDTDASIVINGIMISH